MFMRNRNKRNAETNYVPKRRLSDLNISGRHHDEDDSAGKTNRRSSSTMKSPPGSIMTVKSIGDSLSPTPEALRLIEQRRKQRIPKVKEQQQQQGHEKKKKEEILPSPKKTSDDNNINILSTVLSSLINDEKKLDKKCNAKHEEEEHDTKQVEEASLSNTTLKVRFNCVSIRDYPIMPGDNPSTESGPPLTVAWDHVHQYTYDFEEFEEFRENTRRISHLEFRVPIKIRNKMLLDLGFSKKEIKQASNDAATARRKRIATNIFDDTR